VTGDGARLAAEGVLAQGDRVGQAVYGHSPEMHVPENIAPTKKFSLLYLSIKAPLESHVTPFRSGASVSA
jgi:hypothetical protein